MAAKSPKAGNRPATGRGQQQALGGREAEVAVLARTQVEGQREGDQQQGQARPPPREHGEGQKADEGQSGVGSEVEDESG